MTIAIIVLDPKALPYEMRVRELCCMCFDPTWGWHDGNDVALCEWCAATNLESALPTKDEWWDESGEVIEARRKARGIPKHRPAYHVLAAQTVERRKPGRGDANTLPSCEGAARPASRTRRRTPAQGSSPFGRAG